jgi:hypothetical protein
MNKVAIAGLTTGQVCGSSVGHRPPPPSADGIIHTFSREELDEACDSQITSLIVHHGTEPPRNGFEMVHRHLELFLVYMDPVAARDGISSQNLIDQLTGSGSADQLVYHAGHLYDRALSYILGGASNIPIREDLPRQPTYEDMVKYANAGKSKILLGLRGTAVKSTYFVPCAMDGIAPLDPKAALSYPLQACVAIHTRTGRQDLLAKRYLAQTIERFVTDRRLIFDAASQTCLTQSMLSVA